MTTPRWVGRSDQAFPALLRSIPDPPAGLWLRSRLDAAALADRWREAPAVALVGSRGASSAGLEIARDFAWGLARAGVILVSGLARGIDGAAHAGALAAGGTSLAVLGCGVDICYPPEHERLAGEIAARGALLSEYPAGTPALAWHFPRRNRLISGLCAVTVLVEGEARSGAWHTVESALAQGREVMAVPRDPWLPGSVAPNRLLRDGAPPATCARDILALLGGRALQADLARVSGPVPRGAPGRAGRRAPREEASPEGLPWEEASREEALRGEALRGEALRGEALRPRGGEAATAAALEGLLAAGLARGGPATLEQLAGRFPQVPLAQLQAGLVALEIEGRIARDRRGVLRPLEGR